MYAGREQLDAEVTQLLRGVRRVAMEYSPNGAIPYLSRVDAGTAEMIRSRGVEIVSSGDLVQRFEAAWTPEQLATHRRASEALYRIKDRAFESARRALANGERLSECRPAAADKLPWFEEESLLSDSPPIAINSRIRAERGRSALPADRRAHGRDLRRIRCSCWTCGARWNST